jgi:phosphomannomutase
VRVPRDLTNIVKAYDVRGTVPDQLDADTARALGAAFARFAGAPQVVVARDMRESGVALGAAFAEGVTAQGVDVLDAGMGSTDLLYYAAGTLDVPGAMFTASHNPARYNGIKLCLSGARPIGQDSGLVALRTEAERFLDDGVPSAERRGEVTSRDLLADYAAYLKTLVPGLDAVRPLKVVVDCGNGMGGLTVPVVLDGLPLDVVPLYFELDGSFPNHEANPIEPANNADLQARVLAEGADLGLAFDGDADRCFVVDEQGRIVSPSTLTALIAARELGRAPGSTIIHNLITSRAVPEVVQEQGGTPVRTRVGHSFIKAEMARTGAVFGGEHSGHFYFRDFWNADSGMLAALHTIAALGGQDGPLSALLARYERYAASGEVNSTVPDVKAKLAELRERWADASVDDLDGLTFDVGGGSWFNVRPSNTEPLLRLNVEAPDEPAMARLRDEVLGVIRGTG